MISCADVLSAFKPHPSVPLRERGKPPLRFMKPGYDFMSDVLSAFKPHPSVPLRGRGKPPLRFMKPGYDFMCRCVISVQASPFRPSPRERETTSSFYETWL